MGKSWDSDKGGRDEWIKWLSEIFTEVHRVLKPGAHGLVWAIPRTSHWTATALENSGFQVRDIVVHLFGSGFPKSLDVSKAIDKAAGAEREIVGFKTDINHSERGDSNIEQQKDFTPSSSFTGAVKKPNYLTAPSTDAAKQWEGWGTSLKPASEHWILIKKPISERTIALNVQRWGTGAINVDASRIPTSEILSQGASDLGFHGVKDAVKTQQHSHGRFPANVLLDERAAELLDEQTGYLHGSGNKKDTESGEDREYEASSYHQSYKGRANRDYGSQGGGASRFFMRFQYCAKSSQSERNAGLGESRCTHPTVKPIRLMEYLCRLITPPGGKILDPFMGSGTTGIAAKRLGFDFIGIELNPEYFEIATRRIENAKPDEVAPDPQLTIAEATNA